MINLTLKINLNCFEEELYYTITEKLQNRGSERSDTSKTRHDIEINTSQIMFKNFNGDENFIEIKLDFLFVKCDNITFALVRCLLPFWTPV